MPRLDGGLCRTLRALADRYETAAFLDADPAQFMHRYGDPRDQEVMAFIASQLAFGRREQILRHVERICAAIGSRAHGSPAEWLLRGEYTRLFTDGTESFYRMVSHRTMRLLCATLRDALRRHGSWGEAVRAAHTEALRKGADGTAPYLHRTIAALFPAGCTVICHGKAAAAKRLQLFLRWMTRTGSPVDLGLWCGWHRAQDLLMPLDVHVLRQSVALGLIPPARSGAIPAPTLRLAERLTATLAQAFPGDPVRADYALFGLGAEAT